MVANRKREFETRDSHLLKDVALAYGEIRDAFGPLYSENNRRFKRLYASREQHFKHHIIHITYRYLLIADDPATQLVLRKTLGKYLQCRGFWGAVPSTAKLKKAMKQLGYLIPADSPYLEKIEDIRQRIAADYAQKLDDYQPTDSVRRLLCHFTGPNPDNYLSKDVTSQNKKLRRQKKAIENLELINYRATRDLLMKFTVKPYRTAFNVFFKKIKTGLNVSITPTKWGHPRLHKVVYNIALFLNRVGGRQYLKEINEYFFLRQFEKNPRGQLEEFLQFLIRQFLIIQSTPLQDLSVDKKERLLREFKQLINQFSEINRLSTSLFLNTVETVRYHKNGDEIREQSKVYATKPRQYTPYSKRNDRIKKTILNAISDLITLCVTAGQAFLSYYAISLIAPLLGPFAPIVFFACTVGTLYCVFRLFKKPTRDMMKQFVFKRDFLNGNTLYPTGLFILLGTVVALCAAASISFVIFISVATSLPFAPLVAAAPLIAVFVGVVSTICYTALIQNTVGVVITGCKEAINNFLKKSEDTINPVKKFFLKMAELWKNPIRVPDPHDHSKSIPDATATFAEKNRQRIAWILTGIINSALSLFGVAVFVIASIAMLGAMNTQVVAGLQTWLGLSAALSNTISFAVVVVVSGTANMLFNAKTTMALAQYLAANINGYIATPVANFLFRLCTTPIALGKDIIEGTASKVSAVGHFFKTLPKDPQKTLAPVFSKIKRYALDFTALFFSSLGSFALVIGDSPLTMLTFAKAFGGGMGTMAVSLAAFNELEYLKRPVNILPVYQKESEPVITIGTDTPAPAARPAASTEAEPLSGPRPPSRRRRVRSARVSSDSSDTSTESTQSHSDPRIYKANTLAAKFTFFTGNATRDRDAQLQHSQLPAFKFPEAPRHPVVGVAA